MADNLSVQKQINDLLKARTTVLEVQTEIIKDQVSLASALQQAMEGADPEALVDRFTEVREALNAVARESDAAGRSMDEALKEGAKSVLGAGDAANSLSDRLRRASKDSKLAGMGLKFGFADLGVKAMNLAFHAVKNIISGLAQVASSAFQIGKAILSWPLKVFQNLLDMSDAAARAFLHIAQAWEKVRAQFGDPTEDINRSIHNLVGGMRQLSGTAESLTRLGLYSVFNDQADASAYAADLFDKLGTAGSILGDEIASLGMDFVVFQKGMGLAGEEMRALADRAITSGRPIREVLDEVANMSLQLSEAFGFSGKLVSRDMGKMIKDVSRFGNLSVKSLGKTATRARSLGLEIEALGKVVDKFLTFDDAAESAAKLAQAFGVNVDSMKLMREASQGGMGAIDELRRAFFEAGRDAEEMSVVQLRLLSQNTGLSEEEARLAFSMRNRGKSMEEISKQAGKAQKKELSQAEAMSKLADATERYIRFIEMSDGLFDRFAQGFERGIKHSSEFLKTMFDLRAVSEAVFYAGHRLGRVFVDVFPGINKMLEGFQDLYNPKEFKSMMSDVNDVFIQFFEDLGDPKKARIATQRLLDGLKAAFSDFTQGEGLEKFKSGAQEMMVAFAKGFAGFIPIATKEISKVIDQIGKPLEDNDSLVGTFGSMIVTIGDSLVEGIKSLSKPIAGALGRIWDSGVIQEALASGMTSLADSIALSTGGLTFEESSPATKAMGKAFKELLFAGFMWGLRNIVWRALTKNLETYWSVVIASINISKKMDKWAHENLWVPFRDWALSFGDRIIENFTFDKFVANFREGLDLLLGIFSTSTSEIEDTFSSMSMRIKGIGQKMKNSFFGMIEEGTLFVDKMKDKFNSVKSAISGVFSADGAKKIMEEFIKGMEEGLGDAEDSPIISSMFGAINMLMEKLEIKSPSRFAERMIGANIGDGLTKGVVSSLSAFPSTMLDTMDLGKTNDAVANMKDVVKTDIKAINQSLSSIPEVDLSAKLTPNNKGLGINGETLRVEAGPLNLSLNLTVTMEADQVANVLVEKASMVRKERI